ncbi:MAG: tetratricopeptide repeat protein [Verrucomicrobiota bacterium]
MPPKCSKFFFTLLASIIVFVLSPISISPEASAQSVIERDDFIPLETALEHLRAGEYEEALYAAKTGRETRPWDETWWQLESRLLMLTGKYEEAFTVLEEGINRRPYSLPLRLLFREAALYSDRQSVADEQVERINETITRRSRYVTYPETKVAIGQAAILLGIDARLVLENFFKAAQNEEDPPISAFLASGRLALSKHDYRLASKSFQEGLQRFPEEPDLWAGLAHSFINGDQTQLIANSQKALEINPRHIDAHLLVAEHYITAEAFDLAQQHLDSALEVNPLHPKTLALKAVIAHLQNDIEEAEALTRKALSSWSKNPNVEYTIGQKLARNYRFKEGAALQRSALVKDPSFLSAKIQLAQDLLRLGRDKEGWELAHEVHEADPYNIAAYNLVTLHDQLDDFVTLETEHFLIRMTKKEAPIYGQRAIDLLEPAYEYLSKRYDVEIPQKVTVEIYPNPKDFEVRTFGMPGNPGFLGVCFGPVFTINSPASSLANWEAVLYHEFCHSITLTLTNNRMPRWLSEGISVYEEKEANSSWGRLLNIDYRDRILEENMQPISEMSAAFLTAQTGQDVQFAYYQSALIVKYLFENYGIESMRALLRDLGKGVTMNDALAARMAPLETLDDEFLVYAQELAADFGAAFAYKAPENILQQALDAISDKPNYYELLEEANTLLGEKKWTQAKDLLEDLVSKAEYLPGDENAHILLAQAYRGLEDTANEISTLQLIAENEGDRLSPPLRLLSLALEENDWNAAKRWANAALAIDPMIRHPWEALLDAEQNLGNATEAIKAGKVLIELDVPNLAEIHYRLSLLHKQEQDLDSAKRNVLLALESAPRYRAAFKLLKEIQAEEAQALPTEETTEPLIDATLLNIE